VGELRDLGLPLDVLDQRQDRLLVALAHLLAGADDLPVLLGRVEQLELALGCRFLALVILLRAVRADENGIDLLGVVGGDVLAADTVGILHGLFDWVEIAGVDAEDAVVALHAGIDLLFALLAARPGDLFADEQHFALGLVLLVGLVLVGLLILVSLLGRL